MPPKKPPEFGVTKRLQRAYEAGIRAIANRILKPRSPAQSDTQWLGELAERSLEPEIQRASETLAGRMIRQVNIGNQRTWREAASRTMQSQKLHRLLEAEMDGPTGARVRSLIRENARYISSLPLDAARTLVDEVTKAQRSGARAGTIAKMTRTRFPELLKSRVHLISRTETAKASTALTQARCERLNIEWYQWETSQDQRTRPSHKNMNGVIVPWSQKPAPEALIGEASTLGNYNAGECPNCRCLIIPILTLDDIKFPARVYWNGSIARMTKQQFKKIAVGLEEQDA